MANTIKIKRSSVANRVPQTADLVEAELAINTTDEKVYTKNNAGAIVELKGNSTDKLPLSGGALTGALTTNSTVDGRDVATDGTKLDGIEASATADQTGSQIKTAYQAETNAFTDAQFSKLAAIEASATADQTGSQIKTAYQAESNAFTDAQFTKLAGIEASANVTDTANVVAALSAGTGVSISGSGTIAVTAVALTTVQTANSQSAQLALTAQEGDVVVRSDENKSYVHNGGSAGSMGDYTLLATPTDAVLSVAGNTGAVSAAQIKAAYQGETNAFTDAQFSKLAAIEASATADQTGSQIKAAYQAETNAFTDAQFNKLAGIDASADALPSSSGNSGKYLTTDGSAVSWGTISTGNAARTVFTATNNQTTFTTAYTAGFVDVFLNGMKLQVTADFTATNGSTVVLATGATTGDIVDIIAQGTYAIAGHYTTSAADGRFLAKAGGALTGALTTNSTIDGRDVAADGVLATNALPKAGGTMSGAINMGSNNITTTGKILYANMYSAVGDLPSASTYHGMFAHVHGTGKGYYAHGGAWIELANQTDLASTTTTAGAALPKAGGAMTGAITTNSTFDGRDVAADGVLATNALPKAGGTMSGAVNFADQIVQRPVLKDYAETKVAMAANAVDLALGNVQTKTISGNQTLTFTNPPASGSAGSFTLILTNGGSATVTWPTSIDWAAATAPALTASGVDVLVFTTIDGGTIWYGLVAGLAMG